MQKPKDLACHKKDLGRKVRRDSIASDEVRRSRSNAKIQYLTSKGSWPKIDVPKKGENHVGALTI